MKILDGLQIAQGFLPVDTQTAANAGDWVSLEHFRNVVILLYGAVGTAGDDPVLVVEQATAAAGTGNKAVLFDELYVKQAATNLLSTGAWTRVTQTAATSYTSATAAEQALIWAVEITADMLDVAGGFYFVQGSVADTGAGGAQLAAMLYILGNPVHVARPDMLPSAIA